MTRFQYLFGLAFAGANAMIGAFVAVLILQPVQMSAQAEPLANVKTRKFQLVDKTGSTLIEMGAGDDGGAKINLYDKDGKLRVQVSAGSTVSGVSILDSNKQPRFGVTYDQSEDVVAGVYADAKGRPRIRTLALGDGTPMLSFLDSKEDDTLTLAAGGDGGGLLSISGGGTELGAVARSDGDAAFTIKRGTNLRYKAEYTKGFVVLDTLDSDGNSGFTAGVTNDNRSLWFLRSGGKIRAYGEIDKSGAPKLELKDEAGKVTWTAGK